MIAPALILAMAASIVSIVGVIVIDVGVVPVRVPVKVPVAHGHQSLEYRSNSSALDDTDDGIWPQSTVAAVMPTPVSVMTVIPTACAIVLAAPGV